ncbi:alpha/beta hydrolase [Rhodococcus sp. WS4]|nr:alpha/beta hydrolase [Rhodococcus sp. WS4]
MMESARAIRRGYVDTSDGQLHYRYREGGDDAPILFFHMTASSSAAFESVMTHLSGTGPLYAFDTPNYGQSFKTTKQATIEYICQIFIEAADKLGIDKFYCFGHHTGTNIATQLAFMYPERVLGIMLGCASFTTPEENELYNKILPYDNPPDIRGTHLMRAWTRVVKDCEAATPYDSREPWHQVPAEVFHQEVIDTLTAGEKWYWGYQAVFTHDMMSILPQVKCPILLVAGKRDVVFFWHERAKKALPHAKVVEREGYGVYYCVFAGEDLAPFVSDFVKEVAASREIATA